ncbi:hypothetical protein M2163_000022 [Streptomyces sp. SAI-135]|nr:hypothetical protein [Streptomyces sp. SAI-090]MDH6574366.1 hypothetical protein [Streptomyces sp. SAI-117]MDH6612914.1 hypothetical protein [Streptomyces sp. SAI-135]
MLHRRLARDYETLTIRSEAPIHLAMTDLVARHLSSKPTEIYPNPPFRP